MARKTSCRTVTEQDVPYVWVYLYTNGKSLPVGKPVRLSGAGRVVAIFTHKTGRIMVRSGVSLEITRIDTSTAWDLARDR